VLTYLLDAAQTTGLIVRRRKLPSTFRKLIHKKSAENLDDESDNKIELEHRTMMALLGPSVKAGKAGGDARPRRDCLFFPSLLVEIIGVA
jgi:hypothetical protein